MFYSHGRDITVKLHQTLDQMKIENEVNPGAGMLEVTKTCVRDSATLGLEDFVVIMGGIKPVCLHTLRSRLGNLNPTNVIILTSHKSMTR
jgi:hypothetical protein